MTEALLEQPPGNAVQRSHDVRAVLRIAPFRRLWIALSLSSLGDWLGLLATTDLATSLLHRRSAQLYAIGAVFFVRLLPALVVGPVAGAFADRFHRRYTMVVADCCRCGLYVSIPLVRTLPWLLAASFLVESLSLFWIPAKEASVPNLVPRHRLEAANQLSLVTTYGTGALGAVLFSMLALISGGLATAFPFFRANPDDLALYLDAGTFLFSAATIARLTQIGRAGAGDRAGNRPESFVRSIAEGWRFVGSTRWLRGLTVGLMGAVAAGAVVIGLSRAFVADLRGGHAAYGAIFGTMFVGLASGMFLGPRLLAQFSRRRLMGLAIICAGAALAVDALMPNLLLAILMTYLVGGFAGLVWVVAYTLVGLEVTDDRRGRVFSFLYTLMRMNLLLVVAAAPFIAGGIGVHGVHLAHVPIRLDGVTLTLFAAGVVGAAVGVICYRMMDDRQQLSLRGELRAMLRGQTPLFGRELGGLFVAVEGGEGAGKSTQVRLLADWLQGKGYRVVTTREPGATDMGLRVRELLLDPATRGLSARAEALLYAADRAQHVAEVIQPALRRGEVVVSDRFTDSTQAYQGAGRSLSAKELHRVSQWAADRLVPDLTVLLDLPPAVGRQRVGVGPDRMEMEPEEFHDRVRAGFLMLAGREPRRYLTLDGTLPPDELQRRIRARLEPLLPPAAAVPPAGLTRPSMPMAADR